MQKKDAELASSIISKLLNKNIRALGVLRKLVKSKTNTGGLAIESKKPIEIYISNPPGCTPVAVNALPKTLTEIWKGETNNRLVNINLQGNLLYYSTGGKTTYGTYRISEVCLTKTGTYKIISKTDKGYSVFFIRNVTPQGFELSFCQQPFKTREEIESVDDNFCGAFQKMSLYYENNPSVIYLPLKQGALAGSEKAKLKKIEDSISYSAGAVSRASLPLYDVSYVRRDYIRSNKYIPQSNSPVPDPYLANISRLRKSTRGDIPLSVPLENPFQRYYFTIELEIKDREPSQRKIEPDCNRTFTSISETQKESPLVICKLDLSGARLSAVPSQVYTFTNLKELNFGSNPIPADEIDKLKKALPDCDIKIQPATNTANAVQNSAAIIIPKKEILLGTIYLDGKRYPTQESLDLLKSIASQLSTSLERQIRLEASYSDKSEFADLAAGVKTIKDILTRSGVKTPNKQVIENITARQIQKQMQKQVSNSPGIRVFGINFQLSTAN